MSIIDTQQLSKHYGSTKALDNLDLRLEPGEPIALVGPNGAGKTTMLRALLGLVEVASGSATLDQDDCAQLTATERARLVAYLPQRRPLAWPNKVRDMVALGRFAHGAALGRLKEQDAAAVSAAIESCDLQ